MVPRTPRRSRWTSLLSRAVVPAGADTSSAVAALSPAISSVAADNDVFDLARRCGPLLRASRFAWSACVRVLCTRVSYVKPIGTPFGADRRDASAAVAAVPPSAADNDVFDVEDVLSDSETVTSPVMKELAVAATKGRRSTIEVHVSRDESTAAQDAPSHDTRHGVDTSPGTDTRLNVDNDTPHGVDTQHGNDRRLCVGTRPDDFTAPSTDTRLSVDTQPVVNTRHDVDARSTVAARAVTGELPDLRSELGRQLGAVHERIDDMSQRLDVILRLLANTSPQRRPNNLPVTQFR